MPTKYIIETKNVNSLFLFENVLLLEHNYIEAPAKERPPKEKVIAYWVMYGNRGATLKLSYENERGKKILVKESKINNDDGKHAGLSRFFTP
jgi:hypothetical protein